MITRNFKTFFLTKSDAIKATLLKKKKGPLWTKQIPMLKTHNQFKTALVIRIYKCADTNKTSNYCSISLLLSLTKIYKKVITQNNLNTNNAIIAYLISILYKLFQMFF